MSATTRDKLEFVYAMAKHSTATMAQLQRLLRYGATYARFATDACNRQLTVAEERKWNNVRGRINIICDRFGCTVHYQNDPRGCTVKVVVPDGYTNDFGNEGICVPTA